MDLLRVEDLRLAFMLQGQAHEVVKGVSFRIKPGGVVALVGESGSGKSVISQAIMGILPRAGLITGGKILFNDPEKPGTIVDVAQLPRDSPEMRALQGGRMAMIFQEPMSSLSPVHSVGNQIEEALQLHRPVAKGGARAKTEEMLRLVGFPDPARAYAMYPFELSGGLRQRAMIAMALICRPALLVADEPTTALDVTVQAQVLNLLKDLQKQFGMAILLITHDLGVVANMADEVVVIYHGEIMEAGPVNSIFRKPGHAYLKALLKAVPHFDMRPGERLVALREAKQDITPIAAGRTGPAAAASAPLLSVKDLRKSYGTRSGSWFKSAAQPKSMAVDGVSFEVRRGECLGLVGESGCGKTTVSKLIMRAVSPDSGSITFNDGKSETDVLALGHEALVKFRPKIQMVFQDPVGSLSPRMTVLNILREPLEIHGRGDTNSQNEHVKHLMNAVGLDPRFLSRYPHSFSGGQRQRLGIARALALNPDLIICDEPVSALDVSVQAQILNLLKDLQRELGLTYLFISHNLAVVDYMADRIAVMARGRLVEIAPREALFRKPVHPYTRALLKAVPYPDLDRPLDFKVIELGGASDMKFWSKPFQQQDGGAALQHLEVADGHVVLANPNSSIGELVA